MNKDRRTVFRFAAVGLGVPAVWGVYQMLVNPSPWSHLNSFLSVIFVILCPPVVLTFPLMDVEVGDAGSYAIWTALAILNAALYSGLGSAFVRMRKKREGEATN
jgi:hypothetical protein